MTARFVRLAERDRAPVVLHVDGVAVSALEGDTVLTAVLCAGGVARTSEFGDGRRAGFCLMAACQDCWMWTGEGTKLRACSTTVRAGLSLSTTEPEASWPDRR